MAFIWIEPVVGCQYQIIDTTGRTVANHTTVSFNRTQRVCEHPLDPNLWVVESPYLYQAQITLYRADGTIAISGDRTLRNTHIWNIRDVPD